jgi:exonuclease SbcD
MADIHLGAGASLGSEPGSRLADQASVLKRILARAIEYEAEAILIAGDVFEGPLVTPEQMDVFADFVDGCYGRGIPVVAISGNGVHDAAMRSVNGLAIFDRLHGIDVYDTPALRDLGPVQIACLPWVSPARLIARYGGGVPRDLVNEQAAGLLVRAAAEIADPGVKPTVLLMHGSISGASLPTGISTDDLREPVVDLDALLELGYMAVVAGHIHAPQVGRSGGAWTAPDGFDGVSVVSPASFALYTGSPLPLNFGERDTDHGVWIIDLAAPAGSYPTTRAQFVPIESRPVVQFEYVEGTIRPDVEGAIVKATMTVTEQARRHLDIAQFREFLLAGGAHTVKIDVETVRADRARVDAVTDELEPLDAFDAWAAAGEAGDAALLAAAREQMQADLEGIAA